MAHHTKLYTRHSVVIPASTPQPGDQTVRDHGCEKQLRLSVHDYHVHQLESERAKAGLTLVLTHGTSFNKYLWELVIQYLLGEKQARRHMVKRIITIDAVNHGDSAVLNREVLPEKACWPDVSRDILHTIKYLNVSKPVVGIGHSFGGGAMCHAAMMDPDAFQTTIFLDPILFQMKDQTEGVAQMALRRRDRWANLEEARSYFFASKGFRDWDRRQLQTFVEHGTFDDDATLQRTLKTPKTQEAATYLAAPHPDILNMIKASRGQHYFIWGGDSIVIHKEDRDALGEDFRPSSKATVLPGVGHLMPMTHPELVSSVIAHILEEVAVTSTSSSSRHPGPKERL